MVGRLDRLVGNARDAAVDERTCERLVGGDVKVGEEHEALAQPRVLGLDRFLDLQQEIGLVPGVVDRDDPRTRSFVLSVVKRTSVAGGRLDEHLVAALDQFARTGRRERDTVLVGLDLLRDANSQSPETLSSGDRNTKQRRNCRAFAAAGHHLGRVSSLASVPRAEGIAPHRACKAQRSNLGRVEYAAARAAPSTVRPSCGPFLWREVGQGVSLDLGAVPALLASERFYRERPVATLGGVWIRGG